MIYKRMIMLILLGLVSAVSIRAGDDDDTANDYTASEESSSGGGDYYDEGGGEQEETEVAAAPEETEVPEEAEQEPEAVQTQETEQPAAPAKIKSKDDTANFIEMENEQEAMNAKAQHRTNWFLQRVWYEKGKKLLVKIRDLVDKIVESRTHFFGEQVKLYRDRLDPFYVAVGFDQGKLTELINHLLELLKVDREQEGTLNEQELQRYNTLVEEKTTLETLRVAVADIKEQSNGLDTAFKKLMNEINRARSYEREAEQLLAKLEEVDEEIDDKVAREHYYTIAALWRNVKNIGRYITGPFSEHFVNLGSVIVQRIEQTQGILATLKEKGIELEQAVEQAHQPASEEVEEEEESEPVAAPVGWFTWMWQMLTAPFRWIWSVTLGRFF